MKKKRLDRNKYRLSSFVLAIVMLFTSITIVQNTSVINAQAEFVALSSDEYNALNQMGFLSSDISSLDANALFTRAQFVGVLCKVAGFAVPTYENDKIPFGDVSVDSTYKDEICTMNDLAIVNGTGNGLFSPNASVTYEQAVKMILDVLGYREYISKRYGADFTGYVTMASRLKLSSGVGIKSNSEELTVDKAIKLLYNAGCSYVMEESGFTGDGEITYEINEGKMLLSVNNNIYYGEGLVKSDGMAALSPYNVSEGIAVIDGKEYVLEDTDISSMLGCRVKYFYNDNSGSYSNLLWAAPTQFNGIITVKASDLQTNDARYSLTNIVYEENGRTKEIKLDSLADIVWNYTVSNGKKITPKSGYATFIDNNNDKKYDTVIIEEFDNLFVTSVSAGSDVIFDKYGKTINLSNYRTTKIFMNGKTINTEDIPINRVISVVKSLDNKSILYMYVNPAGVSDVLESTSDDGIYTFSGLDFRLSNSLLDKQAEESYNFPTLQLGRRYKYFLDKDGNIAEITDEHNSGLQYAYIIDYEPEHPRFSHEDSVLFRLLLQDGTKITAFTDGKVKSKDGDFNKVTVTGTQIYNDDRLEKEILVKVRLTEEGKIKEFYFPNGADIGYAINPSTGERFTYDYDPNPENFTRNYTYASKTIDGKQVNSSCKFFGSNLDMFAVKKTLNNSQTQDVSVILKYFVTEDTISFIKYRDMQEEEPYVVKTGSIYSDRVFYEVNLYDVNEKMEIGAVTTCITMSSVGTDLLLVDDVRYVVDEDGEARMQITGIYQNKIATYTEMYPGLVSEKIKSDKFPYTDLKRGDVIRIGLYENQLASVKGITRLDSEKNISNAFSIDDSNAAYPDGTGMVFSRIYSVGEDTIVNLTPEEGKNTHGSLIASSFGGTRTSPVYISIYDMANDTINIGDMRDLVQLTGPDKDGNLRDADHEVWALVTRVRGLARNIVLIYY